VVLILCSGSRKRIAKTSISPLRTQEPVPSVFAFRVTSPGPTALLERWQQVFLVRITFTLLPTNRFVSTIIRVGLSPNGLPASGFRDKWQIWDGKRKISLSPSRIVTFLNFFLYRRGQNVAFFGKDVTKNVTIQKNIFLCARASHSSQKCDKCDASHFLSPKKVTKVTSLTQIWDCRGSWEEIRVTPVAGLNLLW